MGKREGGGGGCQATKPMAIPTDRGLSPLFAAAAPTTGGHSSSTRVRRARHHGMDWPSSALFHGAVRLGWLACQPLSLCLIDQGLRTRRRAVPFFLAPCGPCKNGRSRMCPLRASYWLLSVGSRVAPCVICLELGSEANCSTASSLVPSKNRFLCIRNFFFPFY